MNSHAHSRSKSDYASLILIIAFLLACLASVKAQDNDASTRTQDVRTGTIVNVALEANNNK